MKKLMLLTLAFLIIFSCTKDDDPLSPNDPPQDETITAQNIFDFRNANLNFASDIFKEIVDQSVTNDNIMISPISISIAFAMLNNGAANNTKSQIKEVLGYGQVPDYCVNNLFLQLANKLDSLNNIIDLGLANSAWFDNDFPVRDTYVDLTKDYFDAEIRNLDLDQTASIDTINAWVSEKTEGKIEEILDYAAVGAEFFLVNAINFQGFWKFPFDADATENRRFYAEDGTFNLVPTMIDTGINEDAPSLKFEYFYGDSVRAVKMPYGNPDSKEGKDVSMYVFVPTGILEDFIGTKLTVENWNIWMNSFKTFDQQFPEFENEFNFSMPKFKFGFESNLIPILQALGMTDAFIEGLADFSGMTEAWQSLFIGLVKHKSFIDVNEEGTSAAAVTIIGGYDSEIPPEFRVDKPFFFAIRDDLTGTILFMGQVYDPQY
ncbi:MAG: serpin family protein [Candidatus Delongbacteria bacterium]|nr:serpin family protein [Candidatus Delongbacteria bacterium]